MDIKQYYYDRIVETLADVYASQRFIISDSEEAMFNLLAELKIRWEEITESEQ